MSFMSHLYRFVFKVFALSIYFCLSAHAQDMSLTVITNGKGTPTEMNFPQLKATMRGEKLRWPDGTKVVIALLKTTTPIGTNTSKKIYNMSSNELNKYWLALVFQGKADAPNFFNSEAELEDFVAQTNGAIGIVNHAAAGNKVILIDGQKSI